MPRRRRHLVAHTFGLAVRLRTWVMLCVVICCLGVAALAIAADNPPSSETPSSETPSPDPQPPEQIEFFEKTIRPLLAENCFKCHGPEKQKGGLRVDSLAAILKGGDSGPAVVPGRPDEGFLVDAVSYGDVYQMPPTGKLPQENVDALRTWVEHGAIWPAGDGNPSQGNSAANQDWEQRKQHWCWQPLADPAPPIVSDPSWIKTSVDTFIASGLDRQGLSPAPPTDKRTLLRRVTYDLTGLPPTPPEISAFLADESPGAYARVVDRLLASPHYGERWARHWLDLVRYAETCGHEFDFDLPNAWKYRDYVIRALNEDLPFDQFVVEHVAGDLVSPPRRHPTECTNESILGTGFWFLGEAKHSPVEIREDQAARADNQIDVFAKAFFALTVSCARCHDHKFDAITTKDYYALAGFLRSSRLQEAYLDPPEVRGPAIAELAAWEAGEGNKIAQNVAAGLSARLATLAGELLGRGEPGRAEKLAEYLAGGLQCDPASPWFAWTTVTKAGAGISISQAASEACEALAARQKAWDAAIASSRELVSFSGSDFGDWEATGEAFGKRPTQGGERLWRTCVQRPLAAVLPGGLAHSGRESPRLEGVLRSPTFEIDSDQIWYRLAGQSCRVRLIIDGFQRIQEPIYGGLDFAVDHGEHFIWHAQDVHMWRGHRAYIELCDFGEGYLVVDEIRAADGPPPEPAPNPIAVEVLLRPLASLEELAQRYQETALVAVADWQSGDATDETYAWLTWVLAEGPAGPPLVPDADAAGCKQALSARQQIEARLTTPAKGMAMADGTGEDERVFIRGNHRTLGDAVPRRLPEVLTGGDGLPISAGSGRLQLAHQMVDPAINPLVPRVIVNRLWKHHFGVGIVPTPDDFGRMGQPPSNPDLLDHLAQYLVREGWSLKAVHRLIVLSNTYQMGNGALPRAAELDPGNRWLHHMPPRRLEAESIRDAMLSVSGMLDARLLGPSVPPYLTPFMSGRGRPKDSGPLDGDRRRSIYLAVRRNFLSPLLLAFDFPQPFTCIGRRGVSNVPAQALVMLNNPLVVELAEAFARRSRDEVGDNAAERIQWMYESALGREPTAREVTSATAFIERQGAQHGDGQAERAWSDLGHVLFNAKEFIFVR